MQACRRSARPLKAPGSVLQPPNPPKGFTSRFMIMPGLAGHFRVIALDQRGRGLTSKAPPGPTGQGYDTGTLAGDLAALIPFLNA